MNTRDSKELSEGNTLIKTGTVETRSCPECGSTRTVHNHEYAEIVCMDCGFVVQQKIAERGIERKNDAKQSQNYLTADTPLTYTIHDRETATVIDWHKRDIYSNSSVGQKIQMYRLRKWQRRIRISDSTEHNLVFALAEITKTASILELPKNILEPAVAIYREIIKERLIRGRTTQCIASTALYAVCRQYGLSQTINEIAQASKVSKREIWRSYCCLIKETKYSLLPLQLSQYKNRVFNQFTMQEKTKEVAHKVLICVKGIKPVLTHTPADTVAVSSYVASILMGENKTPKNIAKIAHTTEATIRKQYKEIEKLLMIEISI